MVVIALSRGPEKFTDAVRGVCCACPGLTGSVIRKADGLVGSACNGVVAEEELAGWEEGEVKVDVGVEEG